jgi:hypothetical protein
MAFLGNGDFLTTLNNGTGMRDLDFETILRFLL